MAFAVAFVLIVFPQLELWANGVTGSLFDAQTQCKSISTHAISYKPLFL